MREQLAEFTEKLKDIYLKDKQGGNLALISFLRSLGEIVGIHSIRVGGYAAMTGDELGLPGDRLTKLYTASLLHDIGKLFIPPQILYKNGILDDQELEAIRRHPLTGETILRQVKGYAEFAGVVVHHHEFFNGRGYPGGVSGRSIPLLARIISVADAYEAMTSERPHRKGFSHREAINRLKSGRSTQFDPEVTDAFFKAIKNQSNRSLTAAEKNI